MRRTHNNNKNNNNKKRTSQKKCVVRIYLKMSINVFVIHKHWMNESRMFGKRQKNMREMKQANSK